MAPDIELEQMLEQMFRGFELKLQKFTRRLDKFETRDVADLKLLS
jgi:hypothetical protein